MPRYEELDWRGLDFPKEKLRSLMAVNCESWIDEVLSYEALFLKLYDRFNQNIKPAV
jgi:phosphoenolpyruvate carboxykinase (GTP)